MRNISSGPYTSNSTQQMGLHLHYKLNAILSHCCRPHHSRLFRNGRACARSYHCLLITLNQAHPLNTNMPFPVRPLKNLTALCPPQSLQKSVAHSRVHICRSSNIRQSTTRMEEADLRRKSIGEALQEALRRHQDYCSGN